MATTELVLGPYILVFCLSYVLGGVDSDPPLHVRKGQPITIKCSGAEKPGMPKLQWVFIDVNNISRVIGEHGNPRVRYISETLLELELVNASSQHTGLYACRGQKNGHKSRTEMSLHIVVSDEERVPITCNPRMLKCGERCIASRFRCDRVVDCANGLDELNCPLECDLETEFRCENGQCIETRYVCDSFHALNCRDGSDENHCPDRHYVYTGQIRPVGTGPPPHVLAYEARTWQVHGIYSVVAGVIGLVCVVTIIVITVCRIHMRRDAQLAMVPVSAPCPPPAAPPRPAVAVYVQAGRGGAGGPPGGAELLGLVVSPPPYSELKPHVDAPPPPYEEAVSSGGEGWGAAGCDPPSDTAFPAFSVFPAPPDTLQLQRRALLPDYSEVAS